MTAADLVVTRTHVRFMGRRFACSIGKGGRTDRKAEGDGATPVGVHGIVGCLYRADRMARPNDWAVPIGPMDLWSDDVERPEYNHMVRAPYKGSHENLRRADPLYDLVLVTDWNWPQSHAGRGSAIFVHAWRRAHYPTAGCVAFRPDHLRWIAARITPQTRLIVLP